MNEITTLPSQRRSTQPQGKTPKRILIFLPAGAARIIMAKLAEHGYQAEAICSVPDLIGALRSDFYSLAVTTRPDIDIIRDIKPILVVNLEVFFHSVSSMGELGTTSREFDGKAFVARVKALVEPRLTREKAVLSRM